jgi:D-serine deaminase-like pyridoxal phosphate-dependent protein
MHLLIVAWRGVCAASDLQTGSYCLMDAEYLPVASAENARALFERAPPLRLLCAVVSATHAPRFATVDAGLKAMYKDGGVPIVLSAPHLTYQWWGDEHGKLSAPQATTASAASASAASASASTFTSTASADASAAGSAAGSAAAAGAGGAMALGRVHELVVSHCDPTVNLHEVMYVTHHNQVVDVWYIDARGKCQ